ncbi:uncharacterized protein LOC128160860 [Crassostrea angulata]|uniref:uncharacterized protein LOC128160860 n=1 Tax=Magallana angulata TaxID=2784310 RepID=UPI0022B12030|nr:uncharacterized protein LOC128160860 [Crassostrea angulata]
MAVVYKYTIIYFTLVIQESMSSYIDRDMCLETVARFNDDRHKCYFNSMTAEDILQKITTCPKKCNFRIDYLHDSNSLWNIDLTISNWEKMLYPCLYNNPTNIYIIINCSSWKASEYIIWDDVFACSVNDAQCVRIDSYCVCHCMSGYILEDKKCLKKLVNISGICEFDWQCNGTEFANVCDHGLCSCSPGYIQIDRKCYMYQGNLTLNDTCELTEQCSQPFSVCFQGKCQCINGYSEFDRKDCLKETVPVGGFCSLHEQCTGSNNSGVCENGRCTCSKGFTFIDLSCEKNVNIGVTLGTLFGGFILGVIVTAVATILMHKRLKFGITNREDLSVMFADNRKYGCAGFDDSGARISNRNDIKQNVATLSPFSFAKETQGYNLSSKQEDESAEDVYNQLREQTEHDDDTYDHACAAPNHSTDLSDYSNIQDAATFRTPPSEDGDDYSTLRH